MLREVRSYLILFLFVIPLLNNVSLYLSREAQTKLSIGILDVFAQDDLREGSRNERVQRPESERNQHPSRLLPTEASIVETEDSVYLEDFYVVQLHEDVDVAAFITEYGLNPYIPNFSSLNGFASYISRGLVQQLRQDSDRV